jgi:predicted dehydrogenase
MSDPISRRDFVADLSKLAVAAGVLPSIAPMIVPRHVLGRGYRAPSDTMNVAIVGAGGMGMGNWSEILKAGENVVAICDVDFPFVERQLAGRLRVAQGQTAPSPDAIAVRDSYEKAAKYADFRKMLEENKDIDAVMVATPDHMHAVIAAMAMRAGKHVYVQKPLTFSVHESRALARIAAETKVVTQMGNQGHSGEGTRRIRDYIRAGVIGPVREVHVWTDRPLRYWPQGIPRPVAPPAAAAVNPGAPPPRWSARTVEVAILEKMATNPQSPPPGLDWDLFLGVAKPVAYHPAYHPFSWRGWTDFGVSAIGDMGAHLMDQPYWALDLTYPTSVVASSTPWGGPAANPGSYPMAMTARYEFPSPRRGQPAVSLFWYDGGLMPTLHEEVPIPGGDGGGGIFVGEKGYITYETYGNNPKVYPQAAAERAERAPKVTPRVAEKTHEANWAAAVKGTAQASSPFDYAARLTEIMLLGVVALRAGQGKRILYDGPNMRVTNVADANQWLTREYRAGYSL